MLGRPASLVGGADLLLEAGAGWVGLRGSEHLFHWAQQVKKTSRAPCHDPQQHRITPRLFPNAFWSPSGELGHWGQEGKCETFKQNFSCFMPENKELWFVRDLVKGQAEVGSRINMIPNVGVPILWKLCSELVIGKVWPPSKKWLFLGSVIQEGNWREDP